MAVCEKCGHEANLAKHCQKCGALVPRPKKDNSAMANHQKSIQNSLSQVKPGAKICGSFHHAMLITMAQGDDCFCGDCGKKLL